MTCKRDNQSWSMDFISDSLEDGRKVRIFTLIVDCNRECLAIQRGIGIPSERVIRILEQVMEAKGKPKSIKTDNIPEFTSHAYSDWCRAITIEQNFIQPGKPHQNGYIERFNRTFREDVLDAHLFSSLGQMNLFAKEWKEKYNHGHPHQSLKGMTPIEFKYSRHKIIDAYEKVKAKMNESLQSSALTFSRASMKKCLQNI